MVPPYMLLGLTTLPPSSVHLCTRLLPTLITISSSSIDSPCNSCSAYLLPTVHPGNTPYIRTDPTPLRVVAGRRPTQAVSRSSIFYLGRSRTLQSRYTSRSLGSHPQKRLIGIRIRSSTFYLGRSRMLHSRYTSRCLADRIRI